MLHKAARCCASVSIAPPLLDLYLSISNVVEAFEQLLETPVKPFTSCEHGTVDPCHPCMLVPAILLHPASVLVT